MAYLRRRSDGRVEIRESVATRVGPRARTLAVFRGLLSPDVLEHARARALRPFDSDALRLRARALRVPVSSRRTDVSARALLAELHEGTAPVPVLVGLLRRALAACPESDPPEDLVEVAEWVGQGLRARGRALRGLLRTTDRLVRGRPPRRERPAERFPRFQSRPGGSARPDASSA